MSADVGIPMGRAMTERIRLREICHARAGDKSDTANAGIICYEPAHYPWIEENVTAQAVTDYLGDTVGGPVERYEMPKIAALNFVINHALGGGMSRSLKLDGHGKAYSSILLDMLIDAPPEVAPAAKAKPSANGPNGGKLVRVGAAGGFETDRVDASKDVIQRGEIDYAIFDCQSEFTIIDCYHRKMAGGVPYDSMLELRLRELLPDCFKKGIKFIANAGGIGVQEAAELVVKIGAEKGLKGLKVAYVAGADVLDQVRHSDAVVLETGESVSSIGNELLGAYAYGGAREIVEGLRMGADVVLTSRAGDSAQYLAPLMHEFDWAWDDWERIGKGLGVGHLLECGGQLSGGFFADPGFKEVPDIDRIGCAIAEVEESGDAVVTKLGGTGGVVSEQTCKEQMVYEIHDPADYRHTDGVVDFTGAEVRQEGADRVWVSGIGGHARPEMVKINLAHRENFVGGGRIIYGGTGAYDRARVAADIIAKRMKRVYGVDRDKLRVDFVGVNALFPWDIDTSKVKEVELLITGEFDTLELAEKLPYEISVLSCLGPGMPGWGRLYDYGGIAQPVVGMYSTFLPQDAVKYEVRTLEVS